MPDPAHVPNPDEVAEMTTDVLLAERADVLTIPAHMLEPADGSDLGVGLVVMVSVYGRRNGTDTWERLNVGFSPEGAAELMRTIVESYSGATAHERDAFGRPRT